MPDAMALGVNGSLGPRDDLFVTNGFIDRSNPCESVGYRLPKSGFPDSENPKHYTPVG